MNYRRNLRIRRRIVQTMAMEILRKTLVRRISNVISTNYVRRILVLNMTFVTVATVTIPSLPTYTPHCSTPVNTATRTRA
jgi:hypothetical protein